MLWDVTGQGVCLKGLAAVQLIGSTKIANSFITGIICYTAEMIYLNCTGSCSVLPNLAKWPTQYMQLICVVITIIILCHCHHLCAAILASLLMGTVSYVAYILAYFCHNCISSNLASFWHLRGLFVVGTYFAVAWFIHVVVNWFLVDFDNNVGSVCRLQQKYSWTYIYKVWQAYLFTGIYH